MQGELQGEFNYQSPLGYNVCLQHCVVLSSDASDDIHSLVVYDVVEKTSTSRRSRIPCVVVDKFEVGIGKINYDVVET